MDTPEILSEYTRDTQRILNGYTRDTQRTQQRTQSPRGRRQPQTAPFASRARFNGRAVPVQSGYGACARGARRPARRLPLCSTALAGLLPASDSLDRCWWLSARHSTSAKRALRAIAG